LFAGIHGVLCTFEDFFAKTDKIMFFDRCQWPVAGLTFFYLDCIYKTGVYRIPWLKTSASHLYLQ
jgi:hypothetical protein